jgi:hypothetical protein
MKLYNKALEAQKKAQNLQERQQKLSAFQYTENRQYIELARQKGRQNSRHHVPLEELKSVNYELKRHEEEKLETNLAEQWDLVRSREKLVACVEQAHAELQQESAAVKRRKEALKKEIDI